MSRQVFIASCPNAQKDDVEIAQSLKSVDESDISGEREAIESDFAEYFEVSQAYSYNTGRAALSEVLKAEGLGALSNTMYVHNKTMILSLGTFQAATIIFAVFVSVLKPWRRECGI